MSSQQSIIRQLSSGILSGGVIGVLIGKRQYLLSCLTFTSIGLIDLAYHLNYFKAHITHLTYEKNEIQRTVRSRLNNFQRNLQRELRDTSDDGVDQELTWLWNDILRQIEGHIFYGMGFTISFLLGVVLLPNRRH